MATKNYRPLREGEVSLKDAIEKMLHSYRLKGKVYEAQIQDVWEEIMGKSVQRHTSSIYLKQNKLFVKLDSGVVRQELMYARTRITERLNDALGKVVIEEIVFL